MANREIHSNVKAVQHLSAADYTATQTPTNGVDLQGFDAAEFVISIGVITNIGNSPTPSWTFKLQESDSQASGFTDVTADDDVAVGSAQSPVTNPDDSTGVFLDVNAADEDDAVYRVGYIGTKRYVRVVATAADTPGDTPISIVALLGHAAQRPTAD